MLRTSLHGIFRGKLGMVPSTPEKTMVQNLYNLASISVENQW